MITFRRLHPNETHQIFGIVKQSLFEFVDKVFGWDDAFQQQRIDNDYQPDWFHWLCEEGAVKGLVCFRPIEQRVHVHLLIVFEAHQQQGLGERAMDAIHAQARFGHFDSVTLSCFNCNQRALAFYLRLGYQVSTHDEDFSELVFRLIQ